ncbi:MAG TPA: archease [Gemmatimonadales bacterium]
MSEPVNAPARHELREHTGEIVLRVSAPSLNGLFVEAARGLAELSLGGAQAKASGRPRTLSLEARDPAALLVDWLNELIYLAETERWVALAFEGVEATSTTLRLRARGATLERAPSLVKAATLHGLHLVRENGLMQADVVLDV